MDVFTANIAYISYWDLLHSVPIFEDSFQNIIFACKTLIFINENLLNLSQINLEIYIYKIDKDFMLPSMIKLQAILFLAPFYQMLVPIKSL